MNKGLLILLILVAANASAGLISIPVEPKEDHKKYFLNDDGGSDRNIVVYEEVFATHGLHDHYLAARNAENLDFLLKTKKIDPNDAWTEGLESVLKTALEEGVALHAETDQELSKGSSTASQINQRPNGYGYFRENHATAADLIKKRMHQRTDALCKLLGDQYALFDGEHFNENNLAWHTEDQPLSVISLMSKPGTKLVSDPKKILFINGSESFFPHFGSKDFDKNNTTVVRAPKRVMKDTREKLVVLPNVTFKAVWCARPATQEEITKVTPFLSSLVGTSSPHTTAPAASTETHQGGQASPSKQQP